MGDSCLQLRPFKPCGLMGDCLPNLNKSVSQDFCDCAPGWRRGEEMTLFFLSPQEFNNNIGLCNENKVILLLLYLLVFLSGVGALSLNLYHISNRTQLRRLFPFLLGVCLQTLLATYRLAKSGQALFGKDVAFTFLVGNGACCAWIAMTVLNNRYFRFLSVKIEFPTTTAGCLYDKHRRINRRSILLDLFLYQYPWVITVVGHQQDTTGRILLRIVFGVLSLRVLYYAWSIRRVFKVFIGDLEKFVKNEQERDTKINMVSPKQQKLEAYFREKLLPRTIRLQKVVLSFVFMFFFFLFICSVWEYALMFYGYLFPINFILWGTANIINLNINVKKKPKKNNALVSIQQ